MEGDEDQQGKNTKMIGGGGGEEEEAAKQAAARQEVVAELEAVTADYAVAAAAALHLEEQRNPFAALEMIESDIDYDEDDYDGDEEEEQEEEEEVESSPSQDYEGDDFLFGAQDFAVAELEFMEEEGSNIDDQIEEDDIDLDEMSYEELIALGEIVGEESRGLSPQQISACLVPCVFKFVDSNAFIDRCVICQVEYEEGEEVVALHCQHPFHAECVNHWLQIKKTCPICSLEVTTENKVDKTQPK